MSPSTEQKLPPGESRARKKLAERLRTLAGYVEEGEEEFTLDGGEELDTSTLLSEMEDALCTYDSSLDADEEEEDEGLDDDDVGADLDDTDDGPVDEQ